MIKFYITYQNKILPKIISLYCIFVLLINIGVILFPRKLLDFSIANELNGKFSIVPKSIYSFCDVYMLLSFVIIIIFIIGTSYKNSMSELTLIYGGFKYNKYFIKNIISLGVIYLFLYTISFVNIFYNYVKVCSTNIEILSFSEVFVYSIVTNIFILSLGLFLILLTKDIPLNLIIISSYYLIEEHLWRCKIFRERGVLSHIYYYYDQSIRVHMNYKLIYLVLSVILLIISIKLTNKSS